MANDIAQAFHNWSTSIRGGTSDLASLAVEEGRIASSEMKGKAELGLRLKQEGRAQESHIAQMENLRRTGRLGEIQLREAEKKEEMLNGEFDLSGFVKESSGPMGLNLDAEQKVWVSEMLPKLATAFGADFTVQDKGEGQYRFINPKTGKVITNRDFYDPINQQKIGGLVATMTDSARLLQSMADKGDEEAKQMLAEIEKNPKAYYQGVIERKQGAITKLQQLGVSDQALDFAKKGLEHDIKRLDVLTVTPQELAKHEADMKIKALQQKTLQNELNFDELRRRKINEEISKLKLASDFSPGMKAMISLKQKEFDDASQEWHKLRAATDLAIDPSKTATLNALRGRMEKIEAEIFTMVGGKMVAPGIGGNQLKDERRFITDTGATIGGTALGKQSSSGLTEELRTSADLEMKRKERRSGDPVKALDDYIRKPNVSEGDETAVTRAFIQDYPERATEAKQVLAAKAISRRPEVQGKYIEDIASVILREMGKDITPERAMKKAEAYVKGLSAGINPNKDIEQTAKFLRGLWKGAGEVLDFNGSMRIAGGVWKMLDSLGTTMIEGAAELTMGRIPGTASFGE